jgi:hypothetical protein
VRVERRVSFIVLMFDSAALRNGELSRPELRLVSRARSGKGKYVDHKQKHFKEGGMRLLIVKVKPSKLQWHASTAALKA